MLVGTPMYDLEKCLGQKRGVTDLKKSPTLLGCRFVFQSCFFFSASEDGKSAL